ncbi:sugar phosphate isomerase/epimerase family protein [Halogranum rubrum]|uniref:Xylose isomerase domain protein TIM barrel n=1 Tax=Halogranum salarium B-1 TaxID=1210908 RepID=J3JDR8_9EURY|nr:sugar phosphate isomerase/epimerase [Halogranum salarium]EJN57726.1 Xylose isomerase domain protein TIM barrel [Halogranum salarium B-1]
MTAIGFQLYSLHGVADPLPAVIERVGAAGFDGVELAGLDDHDLTEITDALTAADLDVAGAHVGLDEIEEDPEQVAETYGPLGCDDVVVPWLGPEHFESVAAVEAAAERLDAATAALADYGLSLHYHNHDQEFTTLDGEPALSTLVAATEHVGFELDLGWVGAAGYDPLTVLGDYADRVRIVHLKDYNAETGDVVEVGDGDLDVAAAIAAVREHGCDWLVYEAEERPDSYDTLDHAADVVETHW